MNRHESRSRSRGITLVEALGYRCFRYVRQHLRPFQLLVGPNASGKSTFLDVPGFLGDLLQTDLDTAVRGDTRLGIPHRAPDPRHLTWLRRRDRFELAIELALPPHLVGGKKNGTYSGIRYAVAIEAGESLCVAGETVWLLSEDHEDVPFCPQATLFPSTAWAPDQLLHPPKKRTPKGWKKVLSRGEAGRAYFMSESTGWNAPFAVSPQKPALSSLPEDRERFPCALWLRDTLQAGVRRLELSSAAMRLPAAPTRKAGYLPDGSNLPYVIARLKREDPRRHALWVAHVRDALPDLEPLPTPDRA